MNDEFGATFEMRSGVSQKRWPVILWLLLAYLTSIIMFGKGPTYLGVGPIYWGEMVMLLLLGWMFTRGCIRGFPKGLLAPLPLLVLAFMLLGAVLTAFDFPRWRMDALRDAAIWYYGAFFFIGLFIASLSSQQAEDLRPKTEGTTSLQPSALSPQPHEQSSAFSLQPSYGDRLWSLLVWVWVAALAWDILNRLSAGLLVGMSPIVPGRGVRLLSGSGSENYMHMALGAVLLVLGFAWKQERLTRKLAILALVLTAAGMLFTCNGRGVKVAVMGAVIVSFLATINARKAIWPAGRTFATISILVWLLGVGAILSGPEGLSEAGRLYRFEEVVDRVTGGTAYWRRLWWENITAAVQVENPAFGLGFGINLGSYNPFLAGDESSAWPVRSPHNFNMSVFGRMGYVGLAIWISILIVGLGTLFMRVRRGAVGALRYTLARRKELTFWLMMLTATWLNASFGVLMEGPVLGIPFWFFLGFATGRSAGHDGVELCEEAADAITTETQRTQSVATVLEPPMDADERRC